MLQKLLIANRGEIAVRVIRAARELGIATVAVYSDADRNAIHTLLADQAVHIGDSEAADSYLDPDKILSAANETGADSIHPGYGFLSERARFAEVCMEAGITFVGPPASAMRLLGSKIEAKELAVSAGVPITPGYFVPGATTKELKEAADKIGYPVMLKASAGGGGRGMRIVRTAADFESEAAIASDEALKAFGDGAMMVEKLIERPRHIEVQLLADGFGSVVCLFERECSIQRRHQKLIEEAPSPAMTGALWESLRDAARKLALTAGYVGAGTVEFMVDETAGEFYFLEVNARLQVEHPVTEAITGQDLVQWQLRIAGGERLDLPMHLVEGDRAVISGHSIEVRVVAEDPAKGFLPSSGKILAWAEPKGPGIRVDTGYGPGGEVPRYYDSLIAKVIAHAANRDEAILRLRMALMDFHVLGVRTNVAYLLQVLDHPGFRAGNFDTGFLGREFADWQPPVEVPRELGLIAESALSSAMVAVGENAGPASQAWSLTDQFRNS